jgi:predicted transcriptional regulator of viral defense system
MKRASHRGVPEETGRMFPELPGPPRDAPIGAVARSQHGVVTLHQLQLAGLTASAVRKRLTAGRLTRLHRGVYAVGHAPLTGFGRTMAAVLAYGPRATASHRTAAGLEGLRPDNRAATEISLPLQSARSRPGITAHASPTLRACDVTKRHGIPCTTVARTLLDLADVVPRRQLERAVQQAEVLRVFDLAELEDVLLHANGRRGAAVLRGLLAELTDDPGITASGLEDAFLVLCRDAGLPAPSVNEWISVDAGPPLKAVFLWRARRAGWDTLRFTRRQVLRERPWVVETTAGMLAR